MLWNCHDRTFSLPAKGNPTLIKQSLLISFSPQSLPTTNMLMSLWVCLFHMFHVKEMHNIFKVHSCGSMCQYFLSMAELFSFSDTPHFICLSFDGHLGSFNLLVIVNSAAVSICMQVFVWTPVFTLWGLQFFLPRSEIADVCGNSLCLTFWRIAKPFAISNIVLHPP